jgi:hypothetical protein
MAKIAIFLTECMPSATLDESEFLVCSIMITFIVLIFRNRRLDNHLAGAIATQRREGKVFPVEEQWPRMTNCPCFTPTRPPSGKHSAFMGLRRRTNCAHKSRETELSECGPLPHYRAQSALPRPTDVCAMRQTILVRAPSIVLCRGSERCVCKPIRPG